MSDLTLAERETVFSISADDRNVVHVYSDDPVWIARLKRMGITVAKEAKSGGVWFTMPAKQLTVRRKRELSDEQREALRERGKNLRKAQEQP